MVYVYIIYLYNYYIYIYVYICINSIYIFGLHSCAASKSEICGALGRLDMQILLSGVLNLQGRPETQNSCRVSVSDFWGRKLLLLCKTSVFAFKIFNWLDEAHLHYQGWSALVIVNWWKMLIIFINTCIAMSSLVFDQITGYHSLARLTHKINHPREVGGPGCNR